MPCGFAYKVVGLKSDHSKQPVVYRGVDAADKFVEYMVIKQEEIEKKFKHCEPMIMTGSDWLVFKFTRNCHICKKELCEYRVRDHCHVTGNSEVQPITIATSITNLRVESQSYFTISEVMTAIS